MLAPSLPRPATAAMVVILPGAVAVDRALELNLVLAPAGCGLGLVAEADGDLALELDLGGGPVLVATGCSWVSNRPSRVVFELSSDADHYSLWIEGAVVVSEVPFGDDSTALTSLNATTNFPSTVSFRLDDVRVTALAEAPLFADGFESGDTTAWSSTAAAIPTAPPGDRCDRGGSPCTERYVRFR